MTTIQNHKHDFSGSSDTNSGAACAVAAVCSNNLAIVDQISEGSDSFLYATGTFSLERKVVFHAADRCGTIIQNTKEAACCNRMIYYAVHHQDTTGFTVGHVVAGAIDAGNHVVVFDVEFALGVAILLLCNIGLVDNTRHCPTCSRIIVIVVSVYMNILSGHICSSQIINHGLAVSSSGIVNLLGDARSQDRRGRLEHCEVRIILNLDEIASQSAQIIGKHVTASFAQSGQVAGLEGSGSLQGSYNTIGNKLIVYGITNIRTQAYTIQAVIQEVFSTIFAG